MTTNVTKIYVASNKCKKKEESLQSYYNFLLD